MFLLHLHEHHLEIGNCVWELNKWDCVPCPPNIHQDLFIIAAGDNVDDNLSSSTVEGSYYNTGILLCQYCRWRSNQTAKNTKIIQPKIAFSFPEFYTNVSTFIPSSCFDIKQTCGHRTVSIQSNLDCTFFLNKAITRNTQLFIHNKQ